MGLLIPYLARDHSSYTDTASAPFDDSQLDPSNLSSSRSSSVGDVKVIASYQGFLPTHNLGVQLGVIVSDRDGTAGLMPMALEPSAANPVCVQLERSERGRNARHQPAARHRQPPTSFVGAYYYQAISQDFDAFVNGQFQVGGGDTS